LKVHHIGERLGQVSLTSQFDAEVEALGYELHPICGFGNKEDFWNKLNTAADCLAKEPKSQFRNGETNVRKETHMEAFKLVRNLVAHDCTNGHQYSKMAYDAVLSYYARGHPALVFRFVDCVDDIFSKLCTYK